MKKIFVILGVFLLYSILVTQASALGFVTYGYDDGFFVFRQALNTVCFNESRPCGQWNNETYGNIYASTNLRWANVDTCSPCKNSGAGATIINYSRAYMRFDNVTVFSNLFLNCTFYDVAASKQALSLSFHTWANVPQNDYMSNNNNLLGHLNSSTATWDNQPLSCTEGTRQCTGENFNVGEIQEWTYDYRTTEAHEYYLDLSYYYMPYQHLDNLWISVMGNNVSLGTANFQTKTSPNPGNVFCYLKSFIVETNLTVAAYLDGNLFLDANITICTVNNLNCQTKFTFPGGSAFFPLGRNQSYNIYATYRNWTQQILNYQPTTDYATENFYFTSQGCGCTNGSGYYNYSGFVVYLNNSAVNNGLIVLTNAEGNNISRPTNSSGFFSFLTMPGGPYTAKAWKDGIWNYPLGRLLGILNLNQNIFDYYVLPSSANIYTLINITTHENISIDIDGVSVKVLDCPLLGGSKLACYNSLSCNVSCSLWGNGLTASGNKLFTELLNTALRSTVLIEVSKAGFVKQVELLPLTAGHTPKTFYMTRIGTTLLRFSVNDSINFSGIDHGFIDINKINGLNYPGYLSLPLNAKGYYNLSLPLIVNSIQATFREDPSLNIYYDKLISKNTQGNDILIQIFADPKAIAQGGFNISGYVFADDGTTGINGVEIAATCNKNGALYFFDAFSGSDGSYFIENATANAYCLLELGGNTLYEYDNYIIPNLNANIEKNFTAIQQLFDVCYEVNPVECGAVDCSTLDLTKITAHLYYSNRTQNTSNPDFARHKSVATLSTGNNCFTGIPKGLFMLYLDGRSIGMCAGVNQTQEVHAPTTVITDIDSCERVKLVWLRGRVIQIKNGQSQNVKAKVRMYYDISTVAYTVIDTDENGYFSGQVAAGNYIFEAVTDSGAKSGQIRREITKNIENFDDFIIEVSDLQARAWYEIQNLLEFTLTLVKYMWIPLGLLFIAACAAIGKKIF